MIAKEEDARRAAAEALCGAFKLPGDEEYVEAGEAERATAQFALALLLADALIVVLRLPRTLWDCTNALGKAMAGRAM